MIQGHLGDNPTALRPASRVRFGNISLRSDRGQKTGKIYFEKLQNIFANILSHVNLSWLHPSRPFLVGGDHIQLSWGV